MEAHNFKNLRVWQLAMDFVKEVYLISVHFPVDERFGLTAQVRRAVVSIPSNIAEGSERGSNRDFAHFLRISLSSAYEVETQLIAAKMLGFLSENDLGSLSSRLQEIQKMLFVLQRKVSGGVIGFFFALFF